MRQEMSAPGDSAIRLLLDSRVEVVLPVPDALVPQSFDIRVVVHEAGSTEIHGLVGIEDTEDPLRIPQVVVRITRGPNACG